MSTLATPDREGRLVENLVHFAGVLRACGLPLGPGKVIDAIAAVRSVGLSSREDFYWTLHAVFVSRDAHRALFDQAFHVFWRNPHLLERSLLLSPVGPARTEPARPLAISGRRVAQALARLGEIGNTQLKQDSHEDRDRDEADREAPANQADAASSMSSRERLRSRDFERMSARELERAQRALGALRLPLEPLRTRRMRASARGRRIDLRATLRATLRSGGGQIALVRARPRLRPPALVFLCDISGSMARYSRMLLHFAHALSSEADRAHAFVFGTRLTNVTRQLAHRDVDVALERVSSAVEDWSGGTRIGRSLHEFNREWSRRLLGQGAVVLLVTDGLDRDAGEGLGAEMERLQKSCRRLIWLNPLLRYDRFEPRALGMQAMLPHVDEFRSVHNLASIEELVSALSGHRAGDTAGTVAGSANSSSFMWPGQRPGQRPGARRGT